MPCFADQHIADIDDRKVHNWFASLAVTLALVAADRSMPILCVITREAEAMGLRPEGSNSCQSIRKRRALTP